MNRMTTLKHDSIQSTAQLWTPLAEIQQELLSGGAPKVVATVTASITIGVSCVCA